MSVKEKKIFVKFFQEFDKLFAQLKSFTKYDDSMLADYGFTMEEYDDYAGVYLNAKEELKEDKPDAGSNGDDPEFDQDYELTAYSSTKIDYEYIINLIQNIVAPKDETQAVTAEEWQKQIEEVKQYVEELRKDNVMFAALHYRNGKISNASVIKATIDFASYKAAQEKPLPKFKYYAKCMEELKKILEAEIKPLLGTF